MYSTATGISELKYILSVVTGAEVTTSHLLTWLFGAAFIVCQLLTA